MSPRGIQIGGGPIAGRPPPSRTRDRCGDRDWWGWVPGRVIRSFAEGIPGGWRGIDHRQRFVRIRDPIDVDTALNVALEAIDRLKVTASSHERAFLVEVMGRDCGYLALMSGIAGGAECIVLPEADTDPHMLACELRAAYQRGKSHAIVVVAEGARYNADGLTKYFKEHHDCTGFELRVTKLGHIQRGGTPGVFDRLLATRFGAAAVDHVARGKCGILIGLIRDEITATPLCEVAGKKKAPDLHLFKLAQILAK